jgi:hypothetical protein
MLARNKVSIDTQIHVTILSPLSTTRTNVSCLSLLHDELELVHHVLPLDDGRPQPLDYML